MSLLRRWNRVALGAALVVVGASPRVTVAQDIVVSIKSLADVFDDAGYLAKAVAPDEQQGEQIVQMLDQFKAAEFLQGIDRTRPIGVWADLPEGAGAPPSVVAAVPITDFDAMLQTLAQFGIQAEEAKQAPGFTHQITLPDGATTVYVTSSKTYAFLSLLPTGADKLKGMTPKDWQPKQVSGLVSVVARLDQMPDELKNMALGQIDQQMDNDRQQRPDETLAEYRGRLAGMKLVQQAFTGLLRDGTEVGFDWILDRTKQELAVELSVGGKSGSPMAKTIAGVAARASRFQPLSAGAPMAGWLSVPVPKPIRDALGESIEESRKEALGKAKDDDEKGLINLMVDALKPTILSDAADVGLAVQGPDAAGKYRIVGGSKLVDGLKVEAAVREAVKKAKPDDNVVITLDAGKTADGASIHKIQGKVDDDAARSFGKDAALSVAFKADGVYVAFGEGGDKALSQAIAAAKPATGGTAVPMELVARVAKLAAMAPDADQRVATEKAAAEVFKGANAGKDQVRTLLRGDGDTLRFRFGVDVPALGFFSRVGATSQLVNQ